MNGFVRTILPTLRSRLVIAALILVGLYFLSERWQAPRAEARGPRFTRTRAAGGNLILQGWVSTNKIDEGEVLDFWISATNNTRLPVSGIRMLASPRIAGFVRTGACWTDQGLPTCDEAGNKVTAPGDLAPDQTLTLHAKLRADSDSGAFSPMVVFASRKKGGGESREALLIGPVEVTNRWRERTLNAARRVLEIAKDIAIPLAIFLIGLSFQKTTQAHLEAVKQEEDERTRRAQVWQGLLTQNFKDAQKFYLPTLASVGRMLNRLAAAEKGDALAREECLFSLLLFMKRMKVLGDHIGGVQFQNRSGEDIVSDAFTVLRRSLENDRRFGALDTVLAVKSINPTDDLVDFHLKYSGSDPTTKDLFARLRAGFETWLLDAKDPFSRYVCLIRVFTLVMEHEVNRPFWEYWYGKPEEFPEAELGEQLKNVETLPSAGMGPHTAEALNRLKKNLRDYVREGRHPPGNSGPQNHGP